jgi:beta-galactosidase
MRLLLLSILLAFIAGPAFARPSQKITPTFPSRENFDAGWEFRLDADSTWSAINLPHDWSIEGPFSKKNPTGQQEGGLPAGMGWYRKAFFLSHQKDQRFFIDFDGIYRYSEVWINGHSLGKRPNGYISFRYELTPWLNLNGPDTITVCVDNSGQPNSRWYSGSGIYRHVWLVTTGQKVIDHWGVFISTPGVSGKQALIRVTAAQRLKTTLFDATGKRLASTFGKDIKVPNPRLWSPDRPYLYTVTMELIDSNNRLQDRQSARVGIRYFRFDPKQGFSLNGQPLKIKGVCLHHDLGALGAAVNTRAIERQLQLLKDMGCNGIRTAHNPPAPELLDLCDKMGFIVLDEAFDMWRKKKSNYDYSRDFDEWHKQDLEDQVKRDRNHPSVFIWSIGNEIREQFDSTGITIARDLAGIVTTLDPTRPVTSALTETDTTKNYIYRSQALDLIGLNYNEGKYDSVPQKYPGHPFLATETTSALATRGHYDAPSDSTQHWPASAKAPLVGNDDYTVSAYDNVAAYWGSTHEETWKVVKRNPFVSGLYVWTGFDYLGEPAPYPWPARSSYFGIIDLAGFPKDVYYMYQSEWTTKPVLHLVPQNWNWQDGQVIDVWAYYSQADEVELFLNNTSLGIRRKQGDDLHVSWTVPFQPGTLKAISRKNGQLVLEQTLATAGPAAGIQLEADRTNITADGSDLSFVTVRITDSTGQTVPDADNELSFQLEGEGSLAGLDNGYQASSESFRGTRHRSYNGLCLAIIRANKKPGRITLRVSAKGLRPATLEITGSDRK